jgi:hypothetical protein
LLDSLQAILKRCDRDPAIFYADQVAAWPQEELAHWIATGVLQPLSPARSLPCRNCGSDHVGEVVYLNDPQNGSVRTYVSCSQCGPSPVLPDALRRWRIDSGQLIKIIFKDRVISPQFSVIKTNRLWRVGKLQGHTSVFPVFFGRQLHYADARGILQQSRITSKAVVFTPFHILTVDADGQGPLILPLADFVAYSSGALVFHLEQVADRVIEWQQCQAPAAKHRIRKRASRTADIAALKKELRDHLLAARNHAVETRDQYSEPHLLPRPTQEDLAQRIGASQWSVSRCLNDTDAWELKFLWELALDVDRILAYGG